MIYRSQVFRGILEPSPYIQISNAPSEGQFPYHIDYDNKQWSFETIKDVIAVYAKKSLTHQSDALAALTGILNRISKPTQVKFVYGHLKADFVHSLLWSPDFDRRLDRRIGVPTWS
jgi:hypothetical protein